MADSFFNPAPAPSPTPPSPTANHRLNIVAPFSKAFMLVAERFSALLVYVVLMGVLTAPLTVARVLIHVTAWGASTYLATLLVVFILEVRLFSALLAILVADAPLGVGAAWKASKRKSLRIFGALVSYFLVTLGGSVLFVIPGLIVGVWYVFASLRIASGEDTGIRAAFLNAHQYVRGRFFYVCVRVFLGVFVFLALYALHALLSFVIHAAFPNMFGVVYILFIQPILGFSIVALLAAYIAALYAEVKTYQLDLVRPLVIPTKAIVYTLGSVGLVAFFAVPLLMAAYNIGVQQRLRALEGDLNIGGVQTHLFASHRFNTMFRYPASWSDATLAKVANTDDNTVIYLVHNDVGGYTKKFILRKLNTNETVAQYKAGYEAAVKKQNGTVINETTVGGTYSGATVSTVSGPNGGPAIKEAHDIIVFSAATLGSHGLFTVDFYDKESSYLADFASLFSVISGSMTGKVPAGVPDTHPGR